MTAPKPTPGTWPARVNSICAPCGKPITKGTPARWLRGSPVHAGRA